MALPNKITPNKFAPPTQKAPVSKTRGATIGAPGAAIYRSQLWGLGIVTPATSPRPQRNRPTPTEPRQRGRQDIAAFSMVL